MPATQRMGNGQFSAQDVGYVRDSALHGLDFERETRGTLSYLVGESLEYERTFVGNFTLRDHKVAGVVVVARRLGGRNKFQLCNLRDVICFAPQTA